MIYVPGTNLWSPPIYIREDLEDSNDNMFGTLKDGLARIYSTGECYYSRIGTVTLFTEFDLSRYPHDR